MRRGERGAESAGACDHTCNHVCNDTACVLLACNHSPARVTTCCLVWQVRSTQATHANLLAEHNQLVNQHRRAEAQVNCNSPFALNPPMS